MPATPTPQTLFVIPPAARPARLHPDQAALVHVVLRLLVDNDCRHHILLFVLLEAALFALLNMLFNSLIKARQWTCNMNFAQIKNDNGSEFPGRIHDLTTPGKPHG
jgi:hypothetical protein